MGEIIHVVVEELLKLLVDKVDGDLLETIIFEDLKAYQNKHYWIDMNFYIFIDVHPFHYLQYPKRHRSWPSSGWGQ